MKINANFLKGLFENSNITFGAVTRAESLLSKVDSSTSDFMNTLSVAKLTKQLRDAAGLSAFTFQKINNLWDVITSNDQSVIENGVVRLNNIDNQSNDVVAYKEFYNNLLAQFDNTEVQWFDIGHLKGKPMYCMLWHDHSEVEDYYTVMIANQYEIDNEVEYYENQVYFVLHEDSNGNCSITLNGNVTLVNHINWNYYNIPYDSEAIILCYDGNPSSWNNDNFITLDDAEAYSTDVNITNSCYTDIIKQATTDGHIEAQQIRSICNTYGTTDGILALIESIAGVGSLQSVSIIVIIGKLLSQIDSYRGDQSSSAYSVHATPGFVTSIIQTVCSIVLSVVAVILSAVFKAVGAVVMMVYSLLSSLVSMFKENVANTQAKVTDVQMLPLFNYPLVTTQVSLKKMSQSNDFAETFERIKSNIEEYGCAMLCKTLGSINPYTMWIIPQGEFIAPDYNVMVQVLISCNSANACTPDGWTQISENLTTGPVFWSDGNDVWLKGYYAPNTYFASEMYNHTNNTPNVLFKNCQSYLSADDNELARNAIYNIFLFMADSCAGHYGYVLDSRGYDFKLGFDPWHGGHLFPEQWDMSNFSDNFKTWLISNPPSVDSDGYSPDLACRGYWPFVYVLATKVWYYISATVAPSWDLIVKICKMLQAINESMNYVYLYWFNPNTRGYGDSQDLTDLYDINANDKQWKYHYLVSVEDGTPCSHTAADFPNLSRNALLNAIIVTGVGLAAAAVTIAVGKRVAKRIATKNLMIKEANFEKAKKALIKDPKNPVLIKQATKANRKLTKAWKMAGKLGLSTYNGFATGSSTADMGSSTMSNLLSTASGESSGMENMSLDVILNSINGYQPQ